MSSPVLVTPATAPVVSLADLKAHLNVLHDEDDDLISAYEAAAVSWLDGYNGYLGRCIMPQVWEETLDGWGAWPLAFGDVRTIDQLSYLNTQGETAILTTGDIAISGGSVVTAWGPGGATGIRIRYTVGMPETDIPAIRQAIKMTVAHWYRNREAVSDGQFADIPIAAAALVRGKQRLTA